ncbi:DUF4190 domain-containing protein [Herbiconiux liangxiaofengii]|uniref:DUF4190 domain-containing protein n=1 Tax=Herbiconiux liangxiaofengii TaxID=3342795 RepID=UPI0035B70EEF
MSDPQHPGAYPPPPAGPPTYPYPPAGGYPPPPQPGGTAPGDFPGRTLGIVGLIVSIFANVIGLIISIVALNQSKQAGVKNGPALAGVIVGATLGGIGLLIGLIAVVTSFLGIAVAGAAGAAGAGSAPYSTSEPGPASGDGTDVFDLTVGDCFDDWSGDTVYEVPVVDCAAPHDWEVYDDFEVPDTVDGEFPGAEAVDAVADETCLASFETFLGAEYADTVYDYNYLVPTEESWTESDDRLISCVIGDPAGPVTGTLEGAGTGAQSGADSTLAPAR